MLWIKRILFPLLSILSVYLILTYVNTVPFFFLALALTTILILSMIVSKSSLYKAIFLNLAFIVLLMGLGEAYCAGWDNLGLSQTHKTTDSYKIKKSGLPAFNDITGYSGSKNGQVEEKKMYGSEVVYDVTYTMNQFGLRIAPHDVSPARNRDYKNVVFFGCSFTFGTGLNDDETLPYLFEEESGGRYRSYNFAYGGYGPHQMLRILETGRLDKIITDQKPSIAIYVALIDHIDRCTCKYPYFLWDISGPKYQVDSSGNLRYVGKFNDTLYAKIKYKVYKEIGKSYLVRDTYLFRKALGWTRTAEDRDLFVKIILASTDVFTQKYHGDFYVVFRGYKGDKDSTYVLDELRKHRINVITTDEILEHYKDPPEKYAIAHDVHPSKLYNQRIAAYLLSYLNNQK
jgi:hypothetical protein